MKDDKKEAKGKAKIKSGDMKIKIKAKGTPAEIKKAVKSIVK